MTSYKKLCMKSSEFHGLVRENGWRLIRSKGSHYFYEKGGAHYTVPVHGSKEVPKSTEKKMRKEMALK